jgi:predicted permease
MSLLWWDVRIALRSLARRPGLTLLITLLLTLGIGLGTAGFVLLDAIFVHPLPLADLERLVGIFRTTLSSGGEYTGYNSISYPDFLDLRERSRMFSELALYQALPVNLGAEGRAERARGMFVSANYFDLLGMQPARGRFFLPEEDARGTLHAVAVLSYAAWERLFGADPGALGRQVLLNGRSFEIVGVAPKGFTGTDLSLAVDVWLPLPAFRETAFGEYLDERGYLLFSCLGKLKNGVDARAAGKELQAIAGQLAKEYPGPDGEKGFTLTPLLTATFNPRDRGRYVNFGRTITICFGLVLLVVCTSVGSLLLIRGFATLDDLAVRQAVGANRWQALRPRFCEAFLLFALGGLASLPFTGWSLGFLWRLRPPELAYAKPDLRLGAGAIGCALLLTLLTCLIFALLPAVRSFRPERPGLLRAPSALHDRSRYRLRIAVAGQVALALVALVGASLFLQSLLVARHVELGFDARRMLVLTVAPGDQGYDESRGRNFYKALLERINALPGVRSATLSENRLLRGAVVRNEIYRDGEDEPVRSAEHSIHRINIVVPGFFRTAGIPLLAGRDFGDGDCADCPRVAIINRTMAESLWPGEDATGKYIHLVSQDAPPVEVVGIAENARYREVFEKPQFFVYLPLSQSYASTMTLHVRTSGNPKALLPTVLKEAAAVDSQLPLADVGTMERYVADALWFERTSALLLSALGVLALVLALLGVYAAAVYSVARRAREMGIRLAMGATHGRLRWMILRETGAMIGAGVVVGWSIAFFGLRRVVAAQLHAIDPSDPKTYVGQALFLLAAGLLGGYLSSRRIVEIEPAAVLKSD